MKKLFAKLFGDNKTNGVKAPVITFQGEQITSQPGTTALQTLLSAGYDIPNSCQAGACQSCLMLADQTTKANLPEASQAYLTQAEKEQGLFLACQLLPEADLNISPPTAKQKKEVDAEVIAIEPLNNEVTRLRLTAGINYQSGQFINLTIQPEIGMPFSRSYSLASVPNTDDFLECHIKRLPDGLFGKWLTNEAAIGNTITLDGPHGHCYLTDDTENLSGLLLAGIGTGLAPLVGIVRTALERQFEGSINLIVGAKSASNLYLVDELRELETAHKQLNVTFIAQSSEDAHGVITGDIYEYCKNLDLDFARQRVFLCGAESFVQKMKKVCFMKGTNMRQIFADVFLPAGK
jgi:ferredoxin-NADP reductase